MLLCQQAQDSSLLTWDILGCPSLFGDTDYYRGLMPDIKSLEAIPFSGGQWRFE